MVEKFVGVFWVLTAFVNTVAFVMLIASIVASKEACAADLVTQYGETTKIFLQDTTNDKCAEVEATGTAYALDIPSGETAKGCWANYGEIYEIQLQQGPKTFFHYYLSAHDFINVGSEK